MSGKESIQKKLAGFVELLTKNAFKCTHCSLDKFIRIFFRHFRKSFFLFASTFLTTSYIFQGKIVLWVFNLKKSVFLLMLPKSSRCKENKWKLKQKLKHFSSEILASRLPEFHCKSTLYITHFRLINLREILNSKSYEIGRLKLILSKDGKSCARFYHHKRSLQMESMKQ